MVRINQIKNTPQFKGLYNNKFLLSSLEKISDHGASFSASVSFLSAIILRPLMISLTPSANKENKKILSADSISSGLIKFLIALGISIPIETSIKKIKENPELFLKNDLIKKLPKENFDFLTQTIKLSSNLISAIPKSIIGVALIPIVADLFPKTKKEEKKELTLNQNFESYKKQTSFKGNIITKGISNILETKEAQEFANKHVKNSHNIAKNMTVAGDILLTTSGIITTSTSKKINKEEKKPLIINKFLSSAISILGGCAIDNIVQKIGASFVEKFKETNINDKKLPKYLNGLNILRPTIVFALIYYGLIPIATTFITDKLSQNKDSTN